MRYPMQPAGRGRTGPNPTLRVVLPYVAAGTLTVAALTAGTVLGASAFRSVGPVNEQAGANSFERQLTEAEKADAIAIATSPAPVIIEPSEGQAGASLEIDTAGQRTDPGIITSAMAARAEPAARTGPGPASAERLVEPTPSTLANAETRMQGTGGSVGASGPAPAVEIAETEAEALAIEARMAAQGTALFELPGPSEPAANGSGVLATAAPGEAAGDAAAPAAEPEPAEPATQTAAVAPEPAAAAEPDMVAGRASEYVNMRAGPDNGAAVLAVVPANAQLQTQARCQHWCAVVYDGQRGFIYTSFIRR
ncbi:MULTISPECIES: SH3 domain-containing protein [unclassified Roseitalea]|uniref:SH3 domain-containing protein n=1 Tax=unclassified Roseitalea TaxID=2639107 RepID=UPI00273D7589|nr:MULTISPECIES: SH3 domain-containing protein [unclassified Roseitalea]